jgi:hypothetical protein
MAAHFMRFFHGGLPGKAFNKFGWNLLEKIGWKIDFANGRQT